MRRSLRLRKSSGCRPQRLLRRDWARIAVSPQKETRPEVCGSAGAGRVEMKSFATVRFSAQAVRATCACTAGIMVVSGAVVCSACRSPVVASVEASDTPFSQRALPPGTGRAKFLRIARLLREQGDPGSWSEGRTVLLDRAAWARGLALLGQGRPSPSRVSPRPVPPAPASTPDARALEVLGLRARAS